MKAAWMQQPPRDALGVIPHDHEEIQATDKLVRYIPSVHVKLEGGVPKLSSAAFTPSTPPDDPRSSVSVDIKSLLVAEGLFEPYRASSGQGVAELPVDKVRGYGLMVGWDPLPKNSSHGGIWGVGKSKSKQRQLSRDCAILVILPSMQDENN